MLGMSQENLAARIGVDRSTIGRWETGEVAPMSWVRPKLAKALDVPLDELDHVLRPDHDSTDGARTGDVDSGKPVLDRDLGRGLRVTTHKFLPTFIGHSQAERLLDRLGLERPASILECAPTSIDHPDAARCTLHVHPCGVALYHVVQEHSPAGLADLAEWRYRTYAQDPGWAADSLANLLDTAGIESFRPEYVFSASWLHEAPWDDDDLATALSLIATPAPLVDRSDPENVVSLGRHNEDALMASGFEHPDVMPIGVHGVSAGFVGWSGISYHPLAPERALQQEALVALEVLVQAMWCYATHIQGVVENGSEPNIPDQYGWRFLRTAHLRLSTARPQETAQHRLMREAIVQTSGVTEMLRGAQTALRDEMW
jgi:DNA-binding XRE family transcriptional regulator